MGGLGPRKRYPGRHVIAMTNRRHPLSLALFAMLLLTSVAAQERSTAPGSSDGQLPVGLRWSLEYLDPTLAGWDTEVLQGDVQDFVKRMVLASLEGDAAIDTFAESSLLADFSSDSWCHETPRMVRDDGTLSVWIHDGELEPPVLPSSASKLRWASHSMRQAYLEPRSAQRHVKVIQVTQNEDQVQAKVHVHLVGAAAPTDERPEPRSLQLHMLWKLSYTLEEEGLVLGDIQSLQPTESAYGPPAATPLFADITRAALGDELVDLQLGPSLQHWRNQLDASLEPGLLGHHGLAIGDVNGDGLEDVYVCQPGGLPNRLLLRQPDGTTIDVAAQAGVDLIDASQSALFVDLDGDGALDLVLAAAARLLLFRGSGNGEFSAPLMFDAPGVTSIAVADTDGDEDLDIFACGYASPYDRTGIPEPYHDAENGQRNLFLRNDGDGIFIDATAEVGLAEAGRRFSLAAAFEDYDNDGDQDLYVANDFGRNALYRNDDGHFTNVAAELGVEDIGAGMGVDWADVNGDGWMDLLVSNMYSSAGKRIGSLARFHEGAPDEQRAEFLKHARGNSLFLNQQGTGFQDVSEAADITSGRWAWGAVFLDIQNDGWPDIFVPNGFVTGERTKDL